MAEQGADVLQIGTIVEQLCCEGMAEIYILSRLVIQARFFVVFHADFSDPTDLPLKVMIGSSRRFLAARSSFSHCLNRSARSWSMIGTILLRNPPLSALLVTMLPLIRWIPELPAMQESGRLEKMVSGVQENSNGGARHAGEFSCSIRIYPMRSG